MKKSFFYYYSVAVNPTSIRVESKIPFMLKKQLIDLPTFEMPDGTKPFKNFDFKDPQGMRVMGVLTQI